MNNINLSLNIHSTFTQHSCIDNFHIATKKNYKCCKGTEFHGTNKWILVLAACGSIFANNSNIKCEISTFEPTIEPTIDY